MKSSFRIFLIIVILIMFNHVCALAQSLGLNNTTPDASSILDLTATNRGLLVPRMTTAERIAIASPADGLLVYDLDLDAFYYYDATATAAWRPILADSKSTGISGWSTLGNAGTSAATNFLGTSDGIDLVFKTNGTERLRIYNNNGLALSALSTATSTGIDIGALSGATANTAINIGAISGTGTATAITTGAISATGATAYHLNLGAISGANATSHTGINLGNISGATTNTYGINLGTLTGGTTANYGINLGAINSTGATNSYALNIEAISGTGTNTYGINVAALTSTGTTSTGINVAGISGAGTTNTGLLVNTVSGGVTNNFGLKITGTAAAATNFAIYSDAAAKNYFLGKIGTGTTPTSPNTQVDIDGDLAIRENSDVLGATPGTINDYDIASSSFIYITGPTANYAITGFAGGVDGKILIVANNTAFQMQLKHENAGSLAANRLVLNNAANINVEKNTTVIFVYSAGASRWFIVGKF